MAVVPVAVIRITVAVPAIAVIAVRAAIAPAVR
jgi:hypothetical protein